MRSRRSTTFRMSTPPRSWKTHERATLAQGAIRLTIRRILGIDPGLRVTGFGVIVASGGKLRYVASGCIHNPRGEPPERLELILRDLASVILAHQPNEVAVEKVFVNVNPHSTLLLGQARGAALSAEARAHPPP